MAGNLNIRLAGYTDSPVWDDYVNHHEDGLAYHFFAWKMAVEDSYGFDCPYFYAEKDGKICGVVPLVYLRFPFGRGKLFSLPYCDVGGILADTPEIAKALFDHVCRYAREQRIGDLEIRFSADDRAISDGSSCSGSNNPTADKDIFSGFKTSQNGKVRLLLELPGSSEALLASLKSKVRSQVKKAVSSGLFINLGGEELVETFYPVFASNMAHLGSPVHSKSWLRSVLKKYGQNARCGIVYTQDKTPVAGGIILCHPGIVSIPWASHLRSFNRFNPNMFLYWSFMEYAADNGYRVFDFGRSTPGEGTYNFKAQWGAKPRPLCWAKWEISGQAVHPAASDAGAGYNTRGRRLAEKLIRKMPLPAAVFLGSRIRKYIPL